MAKARDGETRRVRGLVTRLSLRTRLLLGVIVVGMIGLLAADFVVYNKIDSYLVGQVDTQLQNAEGALGNALQRDFGNFNFNANTPPGTYGAAFYSSGQVALSSRQFDGPVPNISKAEIARIAGEPIPDNGPPNDTYLSVGSVGDGDFQYQVLAFPVTLFTLQADGSTRSSPGTAVVAIPRNSLNGTLHRLIWIDLIAGVLLLVGLGGLGYAVVRIGLRPLVEIEETAEAIAAGDLTRRVRREDDSSEVGRLGASLNAMLATIEHSFSEQQASEKRLRQFLADASHELRTPVTSIRGYSELFRRGAADRPEDLATAMRRIEEESIRMGGLVDDLLLLARLDQGRPLEQASVDLTLLAADVAADIQIIDPSRSVELQLGEPLIVNGDEARLRQVLANLVQNSIRYGAPGTPITISATRNEGRAEVSVRDEGPGIEAEHLEHLFERFYRADPSRTRGSGGSGLGLSIVASIVDAHGGTVRATSEPGHGSTFTVDLPLASEIEVADDLAERSWSPIPPAEVTRRPAVTAPTDEPVEQLS